MMKKSSKRCGERVSQLAGFFMCCALMYFIFSPPVTLHKKETSKAQDGVPCELKILRSIENRMDFDAFAQAFREGEQPFSPAPRKLDCATVAREFLLPMGEQQYRFTQRRTRKPLVFDTVILSTETQMILLRMETLQDVVDYFVIVEANVSYTEVPKPLVYLENLQKFHKFRDRILYGQVFFPKDVVNIWEREYYSRDVAINLALKHSGSVNDIIMHSDTDEIPNPFVVRLIRECSIIAMPQETRWEDDLEKGIILHQERFHGDLGCYARNFNKWYGTRIDSAIRARKLGGKLVRTRDPKAHGLEALKAGWHLSNVPLGDPQMLRTKFATFTHTFDDSQKKYKTLSDADWAKEMAEGFPNGDYVCDRKGLEQMSAPTGAFAYVNEFGPFMSAEQRGLANFIYRSVCV